MDKITEILINISSDFNTLAQELEKQNKRLNTLENQINKNKIILESIAHTILKDLEN